MTPVFEWAKAVHASDRATTVISLSDKHLINNLNYATALSNALFTIIQ
jgi:hypothetical protein